MTMHQPLNSQPNPFNTPFESHAVPKMAVLFIIGPAHVNQLMFALGELSETMLDIDKDVSKVERRATSTSNSHRLGIE